MSFEFKHINVAVPLPVQGTFTYRVPPELTAAATVGKRVLVPFGNRRLSGFILGPANGYPNQPIKPILEILDKTPLFPASMVPLFRWTADYYMHPIGEVVKCALPGGLNLYDDLLLTLTAQGQRLLEKGSPGAGRPIQKRALALLAGGPLPLKHLRRTLGTGVRRTWAKGLEANGWIRTTARFEGGRTRLQTERIVQLPLNPIDGKGLSPQRQKIINILESNGQQTVAALKEHIPTAARLVHAMAEAGQVRIIHQAVYHDPLGGTVTPDTPLQLSGQQELAVAQVTQAMQKGFATFLLAGVTGSGKTEVYLQLAAKTIARDRTVVVLVPEIALITQIGHRFKARFGEEIAVLHSGLSSGERYRQWLRLARGEIRIAIGARSAVFAPLEGVGLIVVDEEHDPSYKQDTQLRYNARDLAVVRARLENAVAVLGSATPSIQSYHNALNGKFSPLHLTRRVQRRQLPQIDIVDLSRFRDARGSHRWISAPLRNAMADTLSRGEQILLFLNRRGYAGFAACNACGKPMLCKNCDISLTLHRQTNAYRCHYCGFTRPATAACSHCGAPRIRLMGAGTEKIQSAVQKLFPQARVARMDHDTTRAKGAILKIFKGLQRHQLDVLVGTQMVAKGHDFPGITLVGVICADLSLSFPDFRAGERTFQILAQVAGRAGRGDAPGRVVLQTYTPRHFTIMAAQRQDFEQFYAKEITFRKALGYPPFSRMVQIRFSGADLQKTAAAATAAGRRVAERLAADEHLGRSVQLLGPIEAPLSRISNRYRWQMLIKSHHVRDLHRLIRELFVESRIRQGRDGVQTTIDVDPVFMM